MSRYPGIGQFSLTNQFLSTASDPLGIQTLPVVSLIAPSLGPVVGLVSQVESGPARHRAPPAVGKWPTFTVFKMDFDEKKSAGPSLLLAGAGGAGGPSASIPNPKFGGGGGASGTGVGAIDQAAFKLACTSAKLGGKLGASGTCCSLPDGQAVKLIGGNISKAASCDGGAGGGGTGGGAGGGGTGGGAGMLAVAAAALLLLR